MKYDLIHNSKNYDSLKSNFDKLKKKFPNYFHMDEIYSRKLEKFDKIEESHKIKKKIVKKYLERIKKEPENYDLRYDLSIFYQHTLKEYDKSIEIYGFLIDEKYKIGNVSDRNLLYYKLYQCYESLKDYDKSINILESSIEQLNIQLESLQNSTLFSKNSDVSIRKINELIGENYKSIGHIYSELKDKRLIDNYLKAIKYDPHLTFWYISIGGYYLQNEDLNNYEKYMDLWVESKNYYDLGYKRNKIKLIIIFLKSYIFKLFEIGKEEKSLSICKNLLNEENDDFELPNIYAFLNEYHLIRKTRTEKQFEKWMKSKRFRFKNLKKKLDEFIHNNPDFELKSKIKYEPYSWRNPDLDVLRKRRKSMEIEKKSIINALVELENDIFLVSELFESTPYEIIKILINSNKNHLKLLK